MATKVTTMNPFSWSSDTWYFWLSLFALVFVWLSVLTGLGGLYASRLVNKAQADRSRAFELELAKQQARAANAERTLEVERQERLRLEEASGPRNIANSFMVADALKPFAGTGVIIEYLDEDEPRGFARELASVMERAGWRIVSMNPASELSPNMEITGLMFPKPGDRSPEAAEALLTQLRENKIDFWGHPTSVLPPNTIKLVIGRKESKYLADKRFRAVFRDFLVGDTRSPILHPLPSSIQFKQLSAGEQRQFLETISKSQASFPTEIRCPADNDAACELALEIGSLMSRAGWPIQSEAVLGDNEYPSWTGERKFPLEKACVTIIMRWGTPEQWANAGAIEEALKSAGVSVQSFRDVYDRSAPTLLLVSSKKQ